jgi:hypothetical protein
MNGRGDASRRRVFYPGQKYGLNFAVAAAAAAFRRSEQCVRGADVGRACEQQDGRQDLFPLCEQLACPESATQISVSIRPGSAASRPGRGEVFDGTAQRSINSSNSIQVQTYIDGATVHTIWPH